MNVVISGASGFIGRRLLKTLLQRGHTVRVLSRNAGTNLPAGVALTVWDPMKNLPPAEALRGADAVIQLSGEPVAQRWNPEVKRRIRESRVTGTGNLVEALSRLESKPALICGSATGYYGTRGDTPLDESSAPGSGFLAEVCIDWERAAFAAQSFGSRVAVVRTGLALDPRGGALGRMLPPFRLGIGGRLGDGKQWMPWIHLDDLAGIFTFALENPATSGVLNGTAPNPVTNADFTRALGKALHRPAIFPVPRLALDLLFGEMAEALFDSQRILPKRTEAAGYTFRFPELSGALKDLLATDKPG